MKKAKNNKLNLFLHGNTQQILKEINKKFGVNIQEGTSYWDELAKLYVQHKDRHLKIFIERHPQLEREVIKEIIKRQEKGA